MAYDDVKSERPVYVPRIYTDVELDMFNAELQKYREDMLLSDGDTVRVFNEIQFLKDQGAMDSSGAVILRVTKHGDGGDIEAYDYPSKYQVLTEKLYQWSNWLRKKSAIETKKVEGLEDTAKTLII